MRQSDNLTTDQCCITFHEYSQAAPCSPYKWIWAGVLGASQNEQHLCGFLTWASPFQNLWTQHIWIIKSTLFICMVYYLAAWKDWRNYNFIYSAEKWSTAAYTSHFLARLIIREQMLCVLVCAVCVCVCMRASLRVCVSIFTCVSSPYLSHFHLAVVWSPIQAAGWMCALNYTVLDWWWRNYPTVTPFKLLVLSSLSLPHSQTTQPANTAGSLSILEFSAVIQICIVRGQACWCLAGSQSPPDAASAVVYWGHCVCTDPSHSANSSML